MSRPQPPWCADPAQASGRRFRGRWRRFWRATLTRRLFAWFGLTVVATALMVSVVIGINASRESNGWPQERARWERFVERRFVASWDDPGEREALVTSVAEDLEYSVRVVGADDELITERGAACRVHGMTVPIRRGERVLGTVELCNPRARPGSALVWTLVVVALTLWMSSWLIARRLGRPLRDLASLARRLGEGDLSRRAQPTYGEGQEIDTLGFALSEMADRIERQLRDQRMLLAAASHELRTPLGHLRLLVELGRAEDGELGTYDEIDKELVEMEELVDQLLASSRLDFEVGVARRVGLAQVAGEALARAGLSRELLRVEGEVEVRGDPTLLRRALGNLLSNGQRHGGGVASVVTAGREDGVVVFVDDRGPGLGDADLQRLLLPFERDESTRDDGGLGLGLFLVARIARAHGGRVIVERWEGGGRVGVWLPSAKDA